MIESDAVRGAKSFVRRRSGGGGGQKQGDPARKKLPAEECYRLNDGDVMVTKVDDFWVGYPVGAPVQANGGRENFSRPPLLVLK